MSQHLSGTVERVTFHNPENGFAVLRVQVRGRRGLYSVVGNVPRVVAGEYIEATGSWVQDRDHGEQFQATELRCTPPSTIEGIEKYLGSGLVKGIGAHYARKIVAVFGERTLQVIDESPGYLKEIKGIGPRRIQQIRESWLEQKAVRDIMVFLQSHGVGTGRAVRIYRTYGDQAVDLVRQNPYRLATDIWGIGFKTADELAARLGVDRCSPLRARAAIRFVLQELSQQGHVGFPEDGVTSQTADLTDIPLEILRNAVEEERKEGDLVREPGGEAPWLYLKPLFLAELGVARCLSHLGKGSHPLGEVNVPVVLDWVEKKMGLQLAASQRQAITQAMHSKVLVVTGGPGVGKTTIVRGILEIFAARKLRVALTAPTGRAAKRLSETTGKEAKTIHRLLEFDPSQGGFKRDSSNPLDLDLLVVDEASMVDMVLMNQLVRALPAYTCLILVGDVNQLPSVGPGMVLGDIIASGAVPVARLTEIFRQASQSWIVRAAHGILQGHLPESAPAGKGDFYFIEASQPDTILERIITMVRERIPKRFGLDPLADIQLLAPMNRGALGTEGLNQRLQEILNPPTGGPQVERYSWKLRVGDKVIQTQNNYKKEVFNGDLGRVTAIHEGDREVVVSFEGRPVIYDFGELDEISLAYCLSIHKSQGSEYPAVIIPLHTQHFVMLQRNLLYTAVTRGKQLVVVVGTRKALDLAVKREEMSMRCSALKRRLEEMVAKLQESEEA